LLIKQEVQKIMQQFFLNKGEESMLLYEVAKNGDFLLDKPIIVPEKALKSTSERVGVDVRFIIYCMNNLAKAGKGMALIHNHFNNLVFSEQDLITIKKILDVALKRGLSNISFLIFENNSSKLSLKHFRLNNETNKYVKTAEEICYE